MLLRIAYHLWRFRDFIAPMVKRVQRMGPSKWQIGLGLYGAGLLVVTLCFPVWGSPLVLILLPLGNIESLMWAWREAKHERPEPQGVLPFEYARCLHDAASRVLGILFSLPILALAAWAIFFLPLPFLRGAHLQHGGGSPS